jgi:ABC-type nitrate/sulfonate/bicarbonate transport system substrate-binding protein
MKKCIVLLAVLSLLAACGPAPTPEVVEKVVKETVVVEKEVEVTKVVEVEKEVEKEVVVTATPEPPKEIQKIRIAVSGGAPQFGKMPTLLTIERMLAKGYEVVPSFMGKSDVPVTAVVRGDADFGSSSATPVFSAVQAGADLVMFLQARRTEYVMLTIKAIETPADLDGKRLAIHSQVSSTTLVAKALLKDYPGVEPEWLIIPGSPNRVAALLADEIDATPAQWGDLYTAEKERPGDFHVLAKFAEDLPLVVDAVYYAKPEFLEEHADFVKAWIETELEVRRRFATDREFLAEQTSKYVAIDKAVIPATADAYIDSGVWPEDGGLALEDLQYTMDLQIEMGMLDAEPALDLEAIVDRSILDEVLKEMQ